MSWVGRRLIIRKDGVAIAGARAKSVRFNNDPIDVTYEEEDGFRHLLDVLDTREVVIGIDGVLSAPHVEQLIRPKIEGELIDIEVEFPEDEILIAGDAYIQSLQITGEYRNAVTFSASLVLSGSFMPVLPPPEWIYVTYAYDTAETAQDPFPATTFTPPAWAEWVDVLLVGGGGGARPGPLFNFYKLGSGGGGAGGVLRVLRHPVTPSVPIDVAPGRGQSLQVSDAVFDAAGGGEDSTFGGLTAQGGGAGQRQANPEGIDSLIPVSGGYSGGSGGGGAGADDGADLLLRVGGTGVLGQGNSGGSPVGFECRSGSGGGGHMTAGASGGQSSRPNGGDGISLAALDFVPLMLADRGAIASFTSYERGDYVLLGDGTTWACQQDMTTTETAELDVLGPAGRGFWSMVLEAVGGGGGGGTWCAEPERAGLGGYGGGGNGGSNNTGQPGTPHTGGGAGGSRSSYVTNQAAGSGIVFVRYLTEESYAILGAADF